MKHLVSFSLAAFVALSIAGCATAPTARQVSAHTTCRKFQMRAGEATVLCGTREQWAELRGLVESVNPGVTCRRLKVAEACMNAEQWEQWVSSERKMRKQASLMAEGPGYDFHFQPDPVNVPGPGYSHQ